MGKKKRVEGEDGRGKREGAGFDELGQWSQRVGILPVLIKRRERACLSCSVVSI